MASMIKSIKDLSLFKVLDEPGITSMQLAVKHLDKMWVTPNQVESSLRQVAKRERVPLIRAAVDKVTNGEILMVYDSASRIKDIPAFFPCWPFRNSKGAVQVILNLTPFVTSPKVEEGVVPDYQIAEKRLAGLLTYANCTLLAHRSNGSVMDSLGVQKELALLYSKMVTKVIDRSYGISSDRILEDQVRYAAAKFFLCYSLGLNPEGERVRGLAENAVEKTASDTIRDYVEDTFNDNIVYDTPISFYEALPELSPRLAGLGYRTILRETARLFGYLSVSALEYSPYLIALAVCSSIDANLSINRRSIENLSKRSIVALIQEVTKAT